MKQYRVTVHGPDDIEDYDDELQALRQANSINKFIESGMTIAGRMSTRKFATVEEVSLSPVGEPDEKEEEGVRQEKSRYCEWAYSREYCSESYDTECGGLFTFAEDGPKGNEFRYCPFCGGKLKVEPSLSPVGEPDEVEEVEG